MGPLVDSGTREKERGWAQEWGEAPPQPAPAGALGRAWGLRQDTDSWWVVSTQALLQLFGIGQLVGKGQHSAKTWGPLWPPGQNFCL